MKRANLLEGAPSRGRRSALARNPGLGVLALLFAIVLGSCTVVRNAEVLVTIDAEPGVVSASRSVRIRMWGRSVNEDFREDTPLMETATRFPWTVALRPQNLDDTRLYLFEATAFTGTEDAPGNFVAQARVSSGYEPGQILHVYLLLQDSCIGVPCEQLSESCRNGSCQEIPMDVPTFDPDAGFPDASPPLGDCTEGAPELCDHMDNDCDRRVDEGFDFLADPSHCGACENDCDQPHASATCVQGSCAVTCDAGYADCDTGSPDCERSLLDPASCGGCGVVCSGATRLCGDPDGDGPGAPRCIATCPSGQTQCGSSCVDTSTSLDHCGSCDTACGTFPHVIASCTGSCAYECETGYDACDLDKQDADGCEVHTAIELTNCGGCNVQCSAEQCYRPTCSDGECGTMTAPSGTMCDRDGTACTDDRCDGFGTCAGGASTCSTDAGTDAGSCGGGMPCSGGNVCCGGSCCPSAQCCGTSCCGSGETCDGGVCRSRDAGSDAGACDGGCDAAHCCSGSCCGTTCCGATCCDGGVCDTSSGTPTCVSSPPDGGGETGVCGSGACPMPSDACCGGSTCCDTTSGDFVCCGTQCCNVAAGELCNTFTGTCETAVPDAGTGACCSGRQCCDDGFAIWCCGNSETCLSDRTCSGSDPCGGCGTGSICCLAEDGSAPSCCPSGSGCGVGGTCIGGAIRR